MPNDEKKPIDESCTRGNKDLLTLYDIRIKETHHYNTVIWAFPIAFGVLLATELKELPDGSWSLVVAAFFNFALYYTFWRHIRNKSCIHSALITTEKKIRKEYGDDLVPEFDDLKSVCLPKATTIMNYAVFFLTCAFLARALLETCPEVDR